MNLMTFLNRGAAHAPDPAVAQAAALAKAAETARANWLNALLVDQTRAWMNVGSADRDTINGMTTMLLLAGFAAAYDSGDIETPDIRVIRGAISAADQCVHQRGGVISAADAQAFTSAAERAVTITRAASVDAILHASTKAQDLLGMLA